MPSENRQLVRKLFKELLNKGNFAVADMIIGPEHIHHDPASPGVGKGPDGQKQVIGLYRNAFPDLQFKIDDIIEGDSSLTTRYTATGTHKGELWGIAPTNKTVKVEGVVINRISRGRIVETWVMWDALGLMQQLGAVPALEKAKAQSTS